MSTRPARYPNWLGLFLLLVALPSACLGASSCDLIPDATPVEYSFPSLTYQLKFLDVNVKVYRTTLSHGDMPRIRILRYSSTPIVEIDDATREVLISTTGSHCSLPYNRTSSPVAAPSFAYLPSTSPVALPKPSLKPTMKPQEPVCPALMTFELPKAASTTASIKGFNKVNVKRIVGSGFGNKVVLDGYSAKPIILGPTAGSYAISAGQLCNPPSPTMPPAPGQCSAMTVDLQKSFTVNTAVSGYKVNVRRIVGSGVGNKVVLDSYTARPIITQSTAGSSVSLMVSAGALCNAPTATIVPTKKPTAKPVLKPTAKPGAKPTLTPVEPVCPALSYTLPMISATAAVINGYKVNVKRIVGSGVGNKVVLDSYTARPIITQLTAGSSVSLMVSAGALCNAPTTTIVPTKKPTVNPAIPGPVCSALSYELKPTTTSAIIKGYKVNVKRIVGANIGNKVLIDGYVVKPVVLQSAVGSTATFVIAAGGEPCGGGAQQFSPKPTTKPTRKPTTRTSVKPTAKPTTKPSRKPTARPSVKPTAKPSTKPSRKPTARPSVKPTTTPSNPKCSDNPVAVFQLPKGGTKSCRKLAKSKRRNRFCYDKLSNAASICPDTCRGFCTCSDNPSAIFQNEYGARHHYSCSRLATASVEDRAMICSLNKLAVVTCPFTCSGSC